MTSMSTRHPLFLYNQMILRAALEKAAADKQATGSQRQIGNWWTSCMDLSEHNADGKNWIQPTLDRIRGDKVQAGSCRSLGIPAPELSGRVEPCRLRTI